MSALPGVLRQARRRAARRGPVRGAGGPARSARMTQDLVVSLVFIAYAIGHADDLRHGPHLGRAQAGGGDVRSHRRQSRLRPHPVHADQAGLAGGCSTASPTASKMLLKENFKPTHLRPRRLRAGAVGRVHAGAAGLRRHPLRRQLDPGRLSRRSADWFGGRTYPMQIAQLDAGPADRVRLQRPDDHRHDARRLVLGEQVLAARRPARRLADDLLRAGDGPHRARADPALRHGRPGRDGAPAVGHGARLSCRPGASSTSPSPRCCS